VHWFSLICTALSADHQRQHLGFQPSSKVQALQKQVLDFMEKHIYPSETKFNALAQSADRWTVHPLEEDLKAKAKAAGLWNLWIPVPNTLLSHFSLLIYSER
jgi:alkylation response protein AidB-like acyl-CoA dehydrogenase